MFSFEEVQLAMQGLDLPEQVKVIEDFVADIGIDENSADIVSALMMSVLLELDGGTYPVELANRVNNLKNAVAEFNAQRFGT